MYIPRYLEQSVLKIDRTFKVLYVGGPRQVGKTTMLMHLAQKKKMEYVTLDDLDARRLAKNDPDLFLQQYSTPLLIDEVQYAPELFPYIKIRADQSSKKGQYWLTGSQPFPLIRSLQESLAGRVGITRLLGFSYAEKKGVPLSKKPFSPLRPGNKVLPLTQKALFREIVQGSYPAFVQASRLNLQTFYSSYVQTYLDRDISELFGVSKLSSFHLFMQLCAARTGQILSYSDLARDAGVSVHAAREWISILESTSQIYLLQPYFRNRSSRLIKSPKLYFLDTGLAAYLAKWKSPEALALSAMAGAFFETFVMSELIKSYFFRAQEPPFYFFRHKQGHEVNILIEENQKIYPLEIKLASSIKEADLKNIRYLGTQHSNVSKGGIICLKQMPYPLDKNNKAIPVGMIR